MAYTTIKKSGLFFNSKDYNGNSGTQSLTGIGFNLISFGLKLEVVQQKIMD